MRTDHTDLIDLGDHTQLLSQLAPTTSSAAGRLPLNHLDYDLTGLNQALQRPEHSAAAAGGAALLQLARDFARPTFEVHPVVIGSGRGPGSYRSSLNELLSPSPDPRIDLGTELCLSIRPRTHAASQRMNAYRDLGLSVSTLVFLTLDTGWSGPIISQALREKHWHLIDDPVAGDPSVPHTHFMVTFAG